MYNQNTDRAIVRPSHIAYKQHSCKKTKKAKNENPTYKMGIISRAKNKEMTDATHRKYRNEENT